VAKADARKHLGTSHVSAGKRGVGVDPEGMEVTPSETAYAPIRTPSSAAQEAVENPKGPKTSAANAPRSPYGELTIETFEKH